MNITKKGLLTLVVCAGLVSIANAADPGFLFSASAYGTRVNVGNVIKSGPTAQSGSKRVVRQVEWPRALDSRAADYLRRMRFATHHRLSTNLR